MSEEDDDSKVHEATPRKIEEARKRGETPASQELVSALVFAALVASVAAFGLAAMSRAGEVMSSLLAMPERFEAEAGPLGAPVAAALAAAATAVLLPLLAMPLATAVLGFVAQGSVTIAGEKIRPKLRRISPLQGAKQKFGKEGLFNFVKSFGKLCIYATLLAFVFVQGADALINASRLSVAGVLSLANGLVAQFVGAAALILALFGVIDLLWQRHSFFARQRMTQNELKDEMKDSEGDPQQKGVRRQRARELAASGALIDTAKADVVIVNPTHYAVALKWDRGPKSAPIVVAKGVDLVAARIREIANENAVPIRSDPPTARMIHATVAVGEQILPEHFRAVAAAIRFADAMRTKRRGGA